MDTHFTPFAEYIKARAGEDEQVGIRGGFQIQTYKASDTIFKQGDRGHDAYVIKQGSVEVSIVEDGIRSVITTLGEQSVFGEVALLTGDDTRSATVKALEETQVIRIPKKIFDQYLKASPKVISTCLVAIARRLNEFSFSIQARPALLERMARILHLFILHGQDRIQYQPTVSALATALDRSESDIAEFLATMEHVNLVDLGDDQALDRTITLLGGQRFLEKALKVFSMIEGFEPV